jgi:hypothetical protein
MKGITRHWRLCALAVTAAIGAGVVSAVMSGSASSARSTCILVFCNKDVSLGIRNSSKTAIKVEICPKGHANDPGNSLDGPCNVVTETSTVWQGDRKIVFNTNPLGVMISPFASQAKNTRLLFYVSNPLVGLPYIRANGHKVALTEGEHVIRDVDGVEVELRRYADEDRNGDSVKIMRIEIRKWP